MCERGHARAPPRTTARPDEAAAGVPCGRGARRATARDTPASAFDRTKGSSVGRRLDQSLDHRGNEAPGGPKRRRPGRPVWTPAQVGEVGPAFLGEFFARCGTRAGQSLPSRDELTLGYRMRIENCPGPDGSDRVDLVIETARHLVGIEIKIDAREGREQLARYVEAIGRRARQLEKVARVIFLAPFAPSRDDVIAADWSTIRAAAAAALSRRRSEHEISHHLVAQFARHVQGF